ncbi:MAG: transport system permease protein [Herbinix sp.]|nr:transport system permease protein [Herbinix sp.]
MRQKRFVIVTLVLSLLFLFSIILYLSWGSYHMKPAEMIQTLLGKGTKLQNTALLNIRLPRMLVGIFVAIALSTASSLLQTITRNDLVDSSIIGINAGAAVAAVIFISIRTVNYYNELGTLSIYVLPFMAMLGAGIAATVLYLMSSRSRIRPKRLLLVGLGLNAGLNAFITFFTFRGGVSDYNRVLVWISGSLWGSGWSYVKVIIPIVILMVLLVLYNHKKLDVLNLSEEHAVTLGLNVHKERKRFLIFAVILAGMATAFAGNVGFIGLISPHIARRLVGTYHKNFVIVAGMISGVIILFADAISRNLFSPIEIPVGVTISMIGVPYFIYLMMKEK